MGLKLKRPFLTPMAIAALDGFTFMTLWEMLQVKSSAEETERLESISTKTYTATQF